MSYSVLCVLTASILFVYKFHLFILGQPYPKLIKTALLSSSTTFLFFATHAALTPTLGHVMPLSILVLLAQALLSNRRIQLCTSAGIVSFLFIAYYLQPNGSFQLLDVTFIILTTLITWTILSLYHTFEQRFNWLIISLSIFNTIWISFLDSRLQNVLAHMFLWGCSLALFSGLILHQHKKELSLKQLKEASIRDFLTGLKNRRGWALDYEKLEITTLSPVTLLLIDIDHFKQINDQYGHEIGDQVLHELGSFLSKSIRNIDHGRGLDTCYRLGGEEFAILIPNNSPLRSECVANRLCEEVREERFSDKQIQLTISIGLAFSIEPLNLTTFYQQADFALYEAKHGGRNQFQWYHSNDFNSRKDDD